MNRTRKCYLKNKERYDKANKLWYENNPKMRLFVYARKRAKQKGIEFTITIDDFEYVEDCPIMKVPMIKGERFAPSLDRKNSSKGYIPGNVWVISRLANTMKNDATEEELKRFGEWLNSQR